jgi:Predicted thioesterase
MGTYKTTIQVRFRDIDAMGHVNNATYATYLEKARADYFDEVIGAELTSVNTVLVSLEIEFLSPIGPDGDVTISVQVPDMGESSLTMEYEIRNHDTVAATAETVQVAVDPDGQSSCPLPSQWREAISQFQHE